MDTAVLLGNRSEFLLGWSGVSGTFTILNLNSTIDKVSGSDTSGEILKFFDSEISIEGIDFSTRVDRVTTDRLATPVEIDTLVEGTSGPGFQSFLYPISTNLDARITYEFNITNTGFIPIKPGSLNVDGFLNGLQVFDADIDGLKFTPMQSGEYVFDLFAISSSGSAFSFEINVASIWRTQPENVELAASTYQFFTNRIPVAEGFEFLIDTSQNSSDLNDPFYAQFNQENRFINFANNLGSFGEGADQFANRFANLTFAETVGTAFEEIIGSQAIISDGGNPQESIDFFIGAFDFYAAVANERVVPNGVDFDQAVKVVAIGSILNEAFKSDLGRYSNAVDDVTQDISLTGTSSQFGMDLFA